MFELNGLTTFMKDQAKVEKGLKENWESQDVCKDGSVIHYGCQDGKFFAYATWDQMADMLEYCKLAREVELENHGKKDTWLGKSVWVMPEFIRLDLESRGYPVQEMLDKGELKDLHKIFDTEYSAFKLTNMNLSGFGR